MKVERWAHGGDLRTGVILDCLEGDGLPASGCSVAPLLEVGAAEGNGANVDDLWCLSLAGVYAIGDCASHPPVHLIMP